MKRYAAKKYILFYLPPLLVGVVALYFTVISVWYGDSVGYTFFHAHSVDGISYDRVSSLSSIWESQVNHWLFTNGRFVCHFLVQLLSTPVPRIWYDLLNAAVWVWLIFAVGRLCGVSRERPGKMPAIAAMVWLAFCTLQFGPPFQINYVWCGAITAAFFMAFFCRKKLSVGMLIVSAILGFAAGEWNESFSMPVALGVLIYAFRRRFRLTPVQWASGLAYGLGTIVLCVAPGNFSRLGAVNSGDSSLMNGVELILPMLLYPAAYLCMRPWRRENRESAAGGPYPMSFFLIVAVAGYIICAILKFSSGGRMLLCSTLAFTVLIGGRAQLRRSVATGATLLLCVAALASVPLLNSRIRLLNEKYTLLQERYHESADGITVLPDRLYAPEYRDAYLYRMPWVQGERSVNPQKPMIRIYPESLAGIDLERDTNMCVPFMSQGWILIQSKSHPAAFNIEKTILPGLLNKKMPARTVDFSPENDIFVDSTDAVRVAVYINERPYVESSISIDEREL